ncbi:hypothetical protein J2T56_002947 [Natronobacillus azotifigens]|uniref:DUF1672 family protein n=1 Tax=Natronobacillus azotifigens TaxID=472978 RepID=A0A9J6RGK4_9BACI|nr:DUF1672 family protein [Natronobacillus azotifigens]MCZ0704459.1 DUF1672 family protein [Natronobacillus azotifigens]
MKSDDDYYMRVQDYTGEEYTLANGRRTNQIANDNQEIVEEAVIRFFREQYKTDVVVHNIVGNVDGATVFVESVGEPHFYSYAIIPIDVKNEQIMTEHVWSQERQVENAIVTGLYGMVYHEKFENLDHILEGLFKEYSIVGHTMGAVANIGGSGYSNPYYFVQVSNSAVFEEVWKTYLNEPSKSKEEWMVLFKESGFDAESIGVGMHLFMEEENVEPNQDALDSIASAIEEADQIPIGTYSISLHDNRVRKSSGRGDKENSIDRADPNDIIKE